MLGELYIPGKSFVHRLSAGFKLLFLMFMGTTSFFVTSPFIFAIALFCVCITYIVAGAGPKIILQQLKPVYLLVVIIFAVQYFYEGAFIAFLISTRILFLVLLAALVTLTTQISQMVEALEFAMYPFRKIIPVTKVALAITLTIRFIPMIYGVAQELKMAQVARGHKPKLTVMIVPMIIRTLQLSDQIAEAIYARGFQSK